MNRKLKIFINKSTDYDYKMVTKNLLHYEIQRH